MSSGCTEQHNISPEETIQAILEKAAILQSLYYELHRSTLVNTSVEQTTVMNIWEQAPYLKEEINDTASGITTTTIIIKRPEGTYRYDTLSNTYKQDTQIILPQQTISEMINDLRNNQTLTIIGTENISGKTTTILQYTPILSGNSTTMTLWIWNETGVPLKAVSTTESEETTVSMEYTYSNYSFETIPEDIFQIE